MEIGSIVHDIAKTIQEEANVQAVFGQPLKLDTHTVIPVAVLVVSVGGGGGGLLAKVAAKAAEAASPVGAGGGGGIDIATVPVGFLSERDDQVVFTPIDVHEAEGDGVHAGLLNRVLDRVQRLR